MEYTKEIIEQLKKLRTSTEKWQGETIATTVIDKAIDFIREHSEISTLRDQFACQALSRIVVMLDGKVIQDIKAYVATAYKIADEMLRYRKDNPDYGGSGTDGPREVDLSLAAKQTPD